MARETKAQRMERLEAERAQERALREQTYLVRVLGAMRRAGDLGMMTRVREPTVFVVSPNDRDFWLTEACMNLDYDAESYLPTEACMNLDYDDESYRHLEELESYLDEKEEEQRERDRLVQLRRTALEKLTLEERKALGLA